MDKSEKAKARDYKSPVGLQFSKIREKYRKIVNIVSRNLQPLGEFNKGSSKSKNNFVGKKIKTTQRSECS